MQIASRGLMPAAPGVAPSPFADALFFRIDDLNPTVLASEPERMSAGGAILDPADVEHGRRECHLIPAQIAQFGCPQPPGMVFENLHSGVLTGDPAAQISPLATTERFANYGLTINNGEEVSPGFTRRVSVREHSRPRELCAP